MESYSMRRRGPMQGPAANFIFRKVNSRHHENQDVMYRDRNRGGDLVTSTYPGHGNGKQGFQTPKRRESKENPDGRTEGDGMRRVRHRHQRHVMLGQPALFSGEKF